MIGFTDLVFEHFVRISTGAANGSKRVTARVVGRTDEVTSVRVRLTTDVVSPRGVLLVKDRLLSAATVLLAAEFPAAPRWPEWLPDGETPLVDPYHLPGSPVGLTGPFQATSHTRLHVNGKRARYAADRIAPGSTLSRFVVPTILIDAMLRTEALSAASADRLPVAVPLAIRRIDLYQRGNDRELTAQHGALELYCARNRSVAAAGGGRFVVQIKDVQAGLIGHVDRADK